jgi:hypothetical protein
MKIKERMNIYICEHSCHNITVDVNKGVTPFMIGCEFTGRPDRPANPLKMKNGKCIGTASSRMYPKELGPGVPYPVPTHEWYRPSLDEFNRLSDPEKDHVKQGGLLLRKRTNAEPLLHENEWDYEDEEFKREIAVFKEKK